MNGIEVIVIFAILVLKYNAEKSSTLSYEKKYRDVEIWLLILFFSILYLIGLNYKGNTVELLILLYLIYEDELDMEISLDLLLLLLSIKIIPILVNFNFKNIMIISIAAIIFISLYFFSGRNFGLGDVVLGIILSIGKIDINEFIIYFMLMFTIPSILILVGLVLEKLNRKLPIAFVKYIVLAYYLEMWWNYV